MELIEIKIVNTATERMLNGEMATLGLTYAQATVISFLALNQEKDICQKDIEAELGLTHPTVSSILKRLEEKQLIGTEPLHDDRRFKKVVLTGKSHVIVEQMREQMDTVEKKALQGFTDDEKEQLSGYLSRIIQNLK